MRKKINGFTLIELIIAVTISTILMLSIVVFVSNWIYTIKKNDKILSEDLKNIEFEEEFLKTISNINWIYFSWASFWDYETWIFLKTSSLNLPITFIWIKTFTGFCDNFWEDIINATWTVKKLIIKEFVLPEFKEKSSNLNWISYTLSHTWHIIYSWSEVIIWNWIAGFNLNEQKPKNTQLNYASSIIGSGTFLYIADTLNDRILYYNINNNTIKELLWKKEWINKPTSLYFSWSDLLIANSWNWKILNYKDWEWDWSKLNVKFQVFKEFTATGISFTFSWISNITSPNLIWNFTFSWITWTWADDYISNWSSLIYNFSWWSNTFKTWQLYEIQIDWIGPVPINTWSYYVKLDFLTWSVLYTDYFPYFTIWDWNLVTNTWNFLKTLSWWFNYIYSINWPNSFSWEIIDWNFALNNSIWREFISNFPIKDFNYNYLDNVLTLKFNYFKYYDCVSEKHIIKEKILKKLLQ